MRALSVSSHLLAQGDLVGAPDAVYEVAVPEEEECGHGRDAQFCRKAGELVDVHLRGRQGAVVAEPRAPEFGESRP